MEFKDNGESIVERNEQLSEFEVTEVNDNTNYEIVESNRGGLLIFRNDFKFRLSKGCKNGTLLYKCSCERCKVKLTMRNGLIAKEINLPHNHKPSLKMKIKAKVKSSAKRLIIDAGDNARKSYNNSLLECIKELFIDNPNTQISELPSFKEIKRSLYRTSSQRNKLDSQIDCIKCLYERAEKEGMTWTQFLDELNQSCSDVESPLVISNH